MTKAALEHRAGRPGRASAITTTSSESAEYNRGVPVCSTLRSGAERMPSIRLRRSRKTAPCASRNSIVCDTKRDTMVVRHSAA